MSDTVKSQLDMTLSLFDDVSEAIARIDEKCDTLKELLDKIELAEPKSDIQSNISTDANDLRNLLITLRQQLEKSIASDLDPLTTTLKFLHTEIPELVIKVSELTIIISALTNNGIPAVKDSVNAIVAHLSPMKANMEDAGSFARNFNEPMMKLLGKRPDYQIVEGENILMNLSQVIFDLTGRDAVGKLPPPSKPDDSSYLTRMNRLMTHYFKKNFLDDTGKGKSKGSTFFERATDYMETNLWHKILDALMLILVWFLLVNPAQKALRDVQDASSKQFQEYTKHVDERFQALPPAVPSPAKK